MSESNSMLAESSTQRAPKKNKYCARIRNGCKFARDSRNLTNIF